jgi:hypothetical protein
LASDPVTTALQSFSTLTHDIVPDAPTLAAELARLAEFSLLPAQVGQGEQTARLLLCS